MPVVGPVGDLGAGGVIGERDALADEGIHDLRHTAVALWIAVGATPKEVAVRAGHTSVSFTLDRYGHLYPEADATLRDRLEALHAGVRLAGGVIIQFPQ